MSIWGTIAIFLHDYATPLIGAGGAIFAAWKGAGGQKTARADLKLKQAIEARTALQDDYNRAQARADAAETKLAAVETKLDTCLLAMSVLRIDEGAQRVMEMRDKRLAEMGLAAFATIDWLKSHPQVVRQIIKDTRGETT